MDKNSKRSLVIILHEIYGVNDHINYYKDVLTNEGYDVLIPDLLNKESFLYEEEDQAYHFFMNEIGFNKSLQEVIRLIKTNRKKYDLIYIFGFSIGATVAWMSSEYEIDGIIGFYGSRIRNYTEVVPKCSTLLFFSSNEKSFNVIELEQKLKNKKHTKIEIINALHGFMNPFYKNYNLEESKRCIEKCIDFLKRIEEGTGTR